MILSSRTLIMALLFALLVVGISAQTKTRRRPTRQSPPAASPSPPALASSDQWQIDNVEPSEAVRGERVTVTGKFPEKLVGIQVVLNRIDLPAKLATEATPTPTPAPSTTSTKTTAWSTGKVVDDSKSFAFVVPQDARLGRYNIIVNFSQEGKKYEPVSFYGGQNGPFKIVTREPIKISAVYPAVSYAEEKAFSFTVLGEGFSPIPEDNALIVEGQPKVEICSDDNQGEECGKIKVSDDARELEFSDIPFKKYKGPLKVQVRVGDRLAEKPMLVTLSLVSKKTPLLSAAGFIGGLVALVYYVLSGRKWGRIRKRRYSLFEAIFLDKETNTYSLSKFQFYAWTLAGIFGYVYLTTARSLIQGIFEFAPVPENLPGILLISVSTGALASGITNSKGSKGAGEENPSLADFITTGGVVAAERLQFFVWTIVGVLAFIFLIVSREPGILEALPKIPEGFLYLMGVSSFGYLGGKLARKPGPVITQIVAGVSSLSLEIHGKTLSPDATFRIDDVDVLPNQLDRSIHPNGRPKVEVPDEQTEYAKVLRLVIKEFSSEWLEGEHKLVLSNPDGQRAEWPFEVTTSQSPSTPGQQ